MRRLRESWLALGGSALIVALSVTSALGADPTINPAGSVGEQVSEFARSLAPGQNDDSEEPEAEEQPAADEEEQLDEETPDGQEATHTEEESDETLEPGDEGFDWTTVSHGECVSWHAHQDESEDTEAEENDGEAWRNHGEYVSYWAREGCREEANADTDEEATDEEEEAEAAGRGNGNDHKADKPKRNNGANGNGRGNGRR